MDDGLIQLEVISRQPEDVCFLYILYIIYIILYYIILYIYNISTIGSYFSTTRRCLFYIYIYINIISTIFNFFFRLLFFLFLLHSSSIINNNSLPHTNTHTHTHTHNTHKGTLTCVSHTSAQLGTQKGVNIPYPFVSNLPSLTDKDINDLKVFFFFFFSLLFLLFHVYTHSLHLNIYNTHTHYIIIYIIKI